MWTTLKQDAVTRIAAVVAAGLALPYVIPILSAAQLRVFADYYQFFALIGLVILALQFPVKPTERAEEKRFWTYLTIAFIFLLASEFYYFFLTEFLRTLGGRLILDGLYLIFYLVLVLAAETKPHEKLGKVPHDPGQKFEPIGAVVFVFGLLIYFALIPSSLNRPVYITYVPSMYLFLALDIFLLIGFAQLWRASKNFRWRTFYGFLSLTMALFGGTDLLDCLVYAKVLGIRSGTLPDVLWFFPFLALVVTARLRNHVFPSEQQAEEEIVLPALKPTRSRLILYAFTFPILHFSGYALDLLDSASRPARELLVLLVLLVLFAMALIHQTFLEKRNSTLQSDVLRLAAIVESSEDAIVSTTPWDTILTWNAGAVDVYGYFPDEVQGHPLSILAAPDRADEVPGFIQRLKRGEPVEHYETVHMRKDGSHIDVSLSVSPIRDSTGKVAAVSVIARDITEQKRALIAQERHKAAQKMLLVLMHEIYNPLTGILGNLSLLEGEDMPPSAKACVKDIKRSTDQIHSVLGQLRTLDLAEPTRLTGGGAPAG